MTEKYTEFKLLREDLVKRGLIRAYEAIANCMGYLQAVVDSGNMTAEEFCKENGIMVRGMLDAERKRIKYEEEQSRGE